jgi:hypothetical protein
MVYMRKRYADFDILRIDFVTLIEMVSESHGTGAGDARACASALDMGHGKRRKVSSRADRVRLAAKGESPARMITIPSRGASRDQSG